MDDLEVGRHALRTFQVLTPYPVFDSIAMGTGNWKGGICSARCARGPLVVAEWDGTHAHVAPHESCRCGIYGCLSLEHLVFQYPVECRDIITVIAAEGKTYLGSKGLRTQYARVVAYWSTRLGELAREQFEDAKRFDDLFLMAQSYGLDLHMAKPPLRSHLHYRTYLEHFMKEGFPQEFVELFGLRKWEESW
jgi:hypothetical protein